MSFGLEWLKEIVCFVWSVNFSQDCGPIRLWCQARLSTYAGVRSVAMFAGIHAALLLLACGLQGNARNQDVAKPTGLFAFLLYMCCMGLWSLRMKSLRRQSLQRSHFCISAVLLFPCMYGMALSLWHFYFVWMLGASVSYAASKRMLTHQMCDRAAAVEPTCASSGFRKPKPWNISCIKGRKNKKMMRMMFCSIFRPVSCKIRIQEGWHYVCSVVLAGVLRMCSGLPVWQHVWQEYRLVRLLLFALFWLLCGGNTEYGRLSVVCLLCTLGNLHCSWCKMLSFAPCWLVCPSHNATVAAVFAMLVPFAPRLVFPMLEIRNSASRQKEAKCLRWRCRNRNVAHACWVAQGPWNGSRRFVSHTGNQTPVCWMWSAERTNRCGNQPARKLYW